MYNIIFIGSRKDNGGEDWQSYTVIVIVTWEIPSRHLQCLRSILQHSAIAKVLDAPVFKSNSDPSRVDENTGHKISNIQNILQDMTE